MVLDVVAGILWRNGRYLAVQRPAGKLHAGFWEFPGGKQEDGETLEAALVRELREELAITALDYQFWCAKEHIYPGPPQRHVRLYFFHVTAFDGTPLPNEGQALQWVTPASARSLPFLEADRKLVETLASSVPPQH